MQILALTVPEFLAATAAKQPTPGGGSVAALCGALAAALGAMALEYTAGKKAFAAVDGQVREALGQFQQASAMLQELIVEDAAAYEAVAALLKLPEAERVLRPEYVPAVVAAIRVPQAVGGFALHVLERCAGLLDNCNKHLVSDLAIAAVYAHATVHASELNVRVNLPLLSNQEEAAAVRVEMGEMSAKADRVYMEFRGRVLGRM